MTKKLMILGAPGAGKGTQAKRLSTILGIPQISTGDILRSAVAKETKMGLAAKSYMDAGELVPDKVVIGIVDDRLKEEDTQEGYILDGFPRTLVQAKALSDLGHDLDYVFNIEVTDQEVVKRLSGRRTCKICGEMYHIIFHPPKKPGICDKDNGELIQRSDDTEDVIKQRLEVYKNQTEPLVAYYQEKGNLIRVDGLQSPDEVTKEITTTLNG